MINNDNDNDNGISPIKQIVEELNDEQVRNWELKYWDMNLRSRAKMIYDLRSRQMDERSDVERNKLVWYVNSHIIEKVRI